MLGYQTSPIFDGESSDNPVNCELKRFKVSDKSENCGWSAGGATVGARRADSRAGALLGVSAKPVYDTVLLFCYHQLTFTV